MSDHKSPKGEEVQSSLQEAGRAIKREGRHLAGEAKSATRKMARDQKDALADYVSALAQAATRGAEDLDEAGYGRSASTVARTADEVDSFAQRLQGRDPADLWEDVETFAHRHPALLFGASFAAAFGVTRFLKSSAEPQESEFEDRDLPGGVDHDKGPLAASTAAQGSPATTPPPPGMAGSD